uniref:DUF2089 domain-containing protein n=1 Tax=candidate division WOR-3 bacterium TaxID=2052148 RepID=A0A7C4UHK7_UNCW3
MKVPDKCPFCSGKIEIKRFRCKGCNVEVDGSFDLPDYVIDEDIWDFIRLYIKVRGNLKELERIFGVSYPTIRARFEDVRRALGFTEEYDDKSEIISQLEKGEISVDEALKRLENLKKEEV